MISEGKGGYFIKCSRKRNTFSGRELLDSEFLERNRNRQNANLKQIFTEIYKLIEYFAQIGAKI